MRTGLTCILATLITCMAVSKSTGDDQYLTRSRMKAILFEEIDFRSIRFSDAVEYLKAESKSRDPRKMGINILLKLDPTRDPEITLLLGKSSMYKVLSLITEVAEYDWRFIGSTLVLEPKPKKNAG